MIGKYQLDITKRAEKDLRSISEYIAIELMEPITARNTIAQISEAIFELEQLPFRHGLVRDERMAGNGIRRMIVDSYLVFYVVSDRAETVTILRILYGKRQWEALL